MAELIVGHTTHDSAKIWVRGDRKHARASISLLRDGRDAGERLLDLGRASDYTGVATVGDLYPNESYEVVARFGSRWSKPGNGEDEARGFLRTAPGEGQCAPFTFLLGSCNLSTARVTRLRELAVGYLGTSAARRSVKRDLASWYWPWRLLRRPVRWLAPKAAAAVLGVVQKATRYQLREPGFASPFGTILGDLRDGADAAFMIHAGDQIYFDIDFPQREPTVEEYRRTYREAWFEDPDARTLLANLPHYMMLDDHEIADAFANESEDSERAKKNRTRKEAALQAYREYVQARQPDVPPGALYYSFPYGQVRFFVLDTRTERYPDRQEMISPQQMAAFTSWLASHPRDLKFVVSSVPFVAQLRPPEEGEQDERSDKWCGDAFRIQRDEIIDFVHANGIQRLVFLVGDLHCAYHATLRAGTPERRATIHELAAGPINQVEFAQRRHFHGLYRSRTGRGLPFDSFLRSFHGAAASIMKVHVDPDSRPLLTWEVLRTRSVESSKDAQRRYKPHALRGRISFGADR